MLIAVGRGTWKGRGLGKTRRVCGGEMEGRSGEEKRMSWRLCEK